MNTPLKTTLILITAQLGLSIAALAQTPKPPPPPVPSQTAQPPKPAPRSSDKVDLKKLEEKYWSAKDEDYSVIQNRTFSKAGKFYLTGAYGTLVNDPFAQSKMYGGFLGYYFTEDFGIEANYMFSDSKKSSSVTKFNTLAANVSPNYNLPGSAMSLSATYTPFYAKMAFMNMAILYFDMGFTAGFGISEYDQVVRMRDAVGTDLGENKIRQSSPHFEIGVMQQLFLTKNFAFRLDIKNSFYNEKVVTYDPGISMQRFEENNLKNNTIISLGLTLFTN